MKKRTNFFRIIYLLSDALIIFAAYYLSEKLWMRYLASGDNFLMLSRMRPYVLAAVSAFAAIALILFTITDLYQSFRYRKIWNIWLKASIIYAVMIGIIMAVFYLFHIQNVSRGNLLLFFIFLSLFSLVKHFAAINLLRIIRSKGYNSKHVIVIGDGSLAVDYAKTVEDNKRYGITIDGFISGSGEDVNNTGLAPFLGGYDVLEGKIRGQGVDEVVIALDRPDGKNVLKIIECCEKSGTRVSVIPFYNSMISSRPSVNAVGTLKCFELRTSPLDDELNKFVKRSFDIVFSLLIIIMLSPLMVLVALGVKLSSPGPVLFKQERVGIDKKKFMMYKFRSMKMNDSSSTAWSTDHDPRRTKFGSFIRKTSIDELPQFFNVLKGDMSVIGPRPEIPFFVEQFRETIPRYMIKHLVRPGITGWAQVNGYRGDTSIEERIKCDLWYIENWSIGLDIKIMFRTVFGGMLNSEKTA